MIRGIRILVHRIGNENTKANPDNTKAVFLEIDKSNIFNLNEAILDKFREVNKELFNAPHSVLKKIEGSVVDRIVRALKDLGTASSIQLGYGIPVYRANLVLELEREYLPENTLTVKWGESYAASLRWDGPVNSETLGQSMMNLVMLVFSNIEHYSEEEKQSIVSYLLTAYEWDEQNFQVKLRSEPLEPFLKIVNRYSVPSEVMDYVKDKSLRSLDVELLHQIK